MIHVLFRITAGIDYDVNEQPIQDIEQALIDIRAFLVEEFGGYTELEGAGGWRADDGMIVHERSRTWEIAAIYEEASARTNSKAQAAAYYIRQRLNRQAVMLVYFPIQWGFVETQK